MEVDGDKLRELEALWRAREATAGAPAVACRLPLFFEVFKACSSARLGGSNERIVKQGLAMSALQT